MSKVTITLDGAKIKAERRATLLTVCRDQGIKIPTLCYLEPMEPYGACRLCTVGLQRQGWIKYVTACNYPVEDGQVFETASQQVMFIRRLIVESLLARCPEVQVLKDLASEMGVAPTHFAPRESPDRCILCGLCVKVCSEVVGANAIGFTGRGIERTVGTPFGVLPDSCIGCGACAAVCPTKAIEMESHALARFREAPGPERWCRYSRMGLVPPALCPSSYECARCEVDQRFAQSLTPHPIFNRPKGGTARP